MESPSKRSRAPEDDDLSAIKKQKLDIEEEGEIRIEQSEDEPLVEELEQDSWPPKYEDIDNVLAEMSIKNKWNIHPDAIISRLNQVVLNYTKNNKLYTENKRSQGFMNLSIQHKSLLVMFPAGISGPFIKMNIEGNRVDDYNDFSPKGDIMKASYLSMITVDPYLNDDTSYNKSLNDFLIKEEGLCVLLTKLLASVILRKNKTFRTNFEAVDQPNKVIRDKAIDEQELSLVDAYKIVQWNLLKQRMREEQVLSYGEIKEEYNKIIIPDDIPTSIIQQAKEFSKGDATLEAAIRHGCNLIWKQDDIDVNVKSVNFSDPVVRHCTENEFRKFNIEGLTKYVGETDEFTRAFRRPVPKPNGASKSLWSKQPPDENDMIKSCKVRNVIPIFRFDLNNPGQLIQVQNHIVVKGRVYVYICSLGAYPDSKKGKFGWSKSVIAIIDCGKSMRNPDDVITYDDDDDGTQEAEIDVSKK
jgi:hypothetical protein